MPFETCAVTLRDGVRLACRKEIRPDAPSDGFVILLHGRLHTKTRGPLAALSLPFNTIALDARGMGESEGTTGYSNVQQEVDDLQQVLVFLAPTHKILAIAGHSKGAVVALMLAAQHPMPCSLVINVSGRYDASNLLSPVARFTTEQRAQLDRDGSFTWLTYRAGPEPERPLRRPYIVTKEAVEHNEKRTLACVASIPQGIHILSLHGRADGTVPYENALKMDSVIQSGQATNDLFLLEGVAHNWDGPAQPALLTSLMAGWIASRLEVRPTRSSERVDHLGLERGRLSKSATPTPSAR